MKKKLLIFAHRGEARAFLGHYDFKSLPDCEGLYESENQFLLITGEGPWKAAPKLGLSLGLLHEKVSEVINIGIAGALRPSVEVGEVYSIRTVYLEQNGSPQFLSHTLEEEGIDLITCHTRVLSKDLQGTLDSFAPLVDRELWALAQVCSLAGQKLRSFKLVSDRAGDEEICQRVKEESEVLSDRLLKHYLGFATPSIEESAHESWEGFYFTTSMANQRNKLIKSLHLKFGSQEEVFKALSMEDILDLEETPKRKASILIEQMKELLNPVQSELNKSFEELTSELSSSGASIKLPQQFERAQFNLSTHISRPEDIAVLIKALEEFDYPAFVNLIEGRDLNV